MIATIEDPRLQAALITLDRFDRRASQIEPEDTERVYRAVNRRRDILTAGSLPSIRQHFRVERRLMAEALRDEWPNVSMVALSQTLQDHSGDLLERIEKIQAAAAAAWGRRLLREVGLRTERQRRIAQREQIQRRQPEPWLEAALNELRLGGARDVVQITDTTRKQIQAELIAAQEAGEGLFALQKRIDKLYLEQIIPHRSEVIARTEIAAAQSEGSQSAMRDVESLGISILKAWLATLTDQRTRKDHLEAHRVYQANPIPLDQRYMVGASALKYPGDRDGEAKQVISCRCTEEYRRVGAPPRRPLTFPSSRQSRRAG